MAAESTALMLSAELSCGWLVFLSAFSIFGLKSLNCMIDLEYIVAQLKGQLVRGI